MPAPQSKLEPDVVDKILRGLRAGASIEAVAAWAGIAPATYHRWAARGKAEHDRLEQLTAGHYQREDLEQLTVPELRDLALDYAVPGRSKLRKAELVDAVLTASGAPQPDPDEIDYLEFYRRQREVRHAVEVELTGRIVRAASTDWRAAAWFLERSRPDRYGRTTRTELSGPGGGPVTTAQATFAVPEDRAPDAADAAHEFLEQLAALAGDDDEDSP